MDITQKTDEEKDALDPRNMRGCGKPNPGFLYQQEPHHFQPLTTPDNEHCGDLFPSPWSQPLSILLCKDCAARYGLIW